MYDWWLTCPLTPVWEGWNGENISFIIITVFLIIPRGKTLYFLHPEFVENARHDRSLGPPDCRSRTHHFSRETRQLPKKKTLCALVAIPIFPNSFLHS